MSSARGNYLKDEESSSENELNGRLRNTKKPAAAQPAEEDIELMDRARGHYRRRSRSRSRSRSRRRSGSRRRRRRY